MREVKVREGNVLRPGVTMCHIEVQGWADAVMVEVRTPRGMDRLSPPFGIVAVHGRASLPADVRVAILIELGKSDWRLAQIAIVEAAQFAYSPEGRKRGSGAMGGLNAAVAAYNKANERYWVYYNRGTGLAAVMPYDPDEVFPLGDVTYQNQAPGPHYDVVGDFATREEAEAEKKRLEQPLYE